jgi:pyruvate,water dikinase
VRSSAVGEDGDGASFAGQHLTVLNVRDADAAVAAVAAVAASACAESALAYRRGHGDDSVPRCGAVLQRLVPATAAGVMFTRDPLTGADQVVVEAGWALGEAVVSGLVTPDRYRLDRTGRVLERVLGTKDLAVVPAPAGGTTTVRLDAARAARPCLRDDQLAALAELGRRCDEVFGGPSDVEWAFAGDRLSLVQRRPVTALVG